MLKSRDYLILDVASSILLSLPQRRNGEISIMDLLTSQEINYFTNQHSYDIYRILAKVTHSDCIQSTIVPRTYLNETWTQMSATGITGQQATKKSCVAEKQCQWPCMAVSTSLYDQSKTAYTDTCVKSFQKEFWMDSMSFSISHE